MDQTIPTSLGIIKTWHTSELPQRSTKQLSMAVLTVMLSWLITCRDRVNSVYLGQYHGCWCPGSLRRQDISSHDIDYIEYVGPSRIRGSVLSTCVKSMWSNGIKCKYMFVFPLKNLARKGLKLYFFNHMGVPYALSNLCHHSCCRCPGAIMAPGHQQTPHWTVTMVTHKLQCTPFYITVPHLQG